MTAIDVTDALKSIQDAERLRRDIVQQLLDDKLHDETRVLVTAGQMGATSSYVGTVSFRWIDRNVKLFNQIDLIRNRLDERGQFTVDHENLEELHQRAPDWSRQAVLVHYLLRNPARKFPAILLVVTEAWVDNPNATEWDAEGRALKDSVPFVALDSHNRVGLVEIRRGVSVYVVDGQHRYMGIQGLLELLSTGQLTLRASNHTPTGTENLEDLRRRFELPELHLSALEDETMGVEFIPAVLTGETREDARRRLRTTFVHVNKTARPLTAGELAALDEEDGFAIITRRVARAHPLFRKKQGGDRVNLKGNSLPHRTNWLTTLSTLNDMARGYLGAHPPFKAWIPARKSELLTRPSDHELECAIKMFHALWDGLASLPSFSAVINGQATIDELRMFPGEDSPPTSKLNHEGARDKRARKKQDMDPPQDAGRGHLFFRPVGQVMLAHALGRLHANGQGTDLESLIARLTQLDRAGVFDRIDTPKSLWYGIAYSPALGRMITSGKETGARLLEYLLGGERALSPQERQRLLLQFRKARTASNEDGISLYWTAEGAAVHNRELVKLPVPSQLK